MAFVLSQTSIALRSNKTVARKSTFNGSTRALVAARPAAVASRGPLAVKAEKKMWLPGMSSPAYLDGSIPGDYGFDPLGLGSDPDRLKWYQEAELLNGRWAMMAVLGMLIPNAIGVETPWFEAGSALDTPILPLLGIQFPIMGYLETKRYEGWKKTGEAGLVDTFPFDPVGMRSESMKVKEVKNGRLAMVAVFGFVTQAVVTHESPVANLAKHIADPGHNNIITSIGNIQNVV
mmetsp:Transcript_35648/g.42945  ORF Transcript_35648/g.42945 Transcript_35648/m.42945 type:complete len:233 (-) Transcript_35648:113-811(-)|eukprot:CAMPEP_0197846938 /NCGR_PEP_ID=MMETSP1438-20131217/4729_1 /TAXON_ID=1461541 /ORGANISM="Pterosperma sp., Strain CCMP1384" /LENGTH=232 /DNA_ID=CAMNT_0043458729 /DNA_START=65 /DNA_END=763 /DNA_ORIENTATION=-